MVKTPFKQKTGTIFSLYTHQIEVKLVAIKPEFNSGSANIHSNFSQTLPLRLYFKRVSQIVLFKF